MLLRPRAISPSAGKLAWPDPPREKSHTAGTQDDPGEGNVQKEDPDERGGGDHGQTEWTKGPTPDSEQSHDHERDHGGLQAREDSRNPEKIPVGCIDHGKTPQNQNRGDHEERAGHDPAQCPVQEPADVDRELLRLRSGQEHAVAQGMEKALLRDPFLPVHEVALHDRDLAGRPAEADKSEPNPVGKRLREPDHSAAFDQWLPIVKSSN